MSSYQSFIITEAIWAVLCLAAALIRGLGFGDIQVFECMAYVPAAAVIILAAMPRMLADLPGGCC